jgi:prevent-host-death family protein
METLSSIGAYAAKTHLPALLDRVAKGEEITITRHGVPVAVLVPPAGTRNRNVSEVIQDMIEARKGVRLNGLSIREMIDEGRP